MRRGIIDFNATKSGTHANMLFDAKNWSHALRSFRTATRCAIAQSAFSSFELPSSLVDPIGKLSISTQNMALAIRHLPSAGLSVAMEFAAGQISWRDDMQKTTNEVDAS